MIATTIRSPQKKKIKARKNVNQNLAKNGRFADGATKKTYTL